ncbi:MAG: hypothetical protein JW969_19335 [Spirochaetales bacterium]|nr:hypothetical protein [Spirochaetales bacterium]
MARFIGRNLTVYSFYDSILIRCPKCDGRASINNADNKKGLFTEQVLTCEHCGYNKKGKLLIHVLFPKLWLQARCCGKILWALNMAHLQYIKDYVGAGLREKTKDPDHGWRNKSLESCLPGWIKNSKNREKVMKCIIRLEEKIK